MLFNTLLRFFAELDQHASRLISDGLAYNSKKSYTTALGRYIHFCQLYGLDPLHVTEETFIRFVAHLAAFNLSVRSIRVYLAGVRAWIISNGFPPPPVYSQRLKWALRALVNQTLWLPRQYHTRYWSRCNSAL